MICNALQVYCNFYLHFAIKHIYLHSDNNNNKMKTLIEYIDFTAICKDNNLVSGDISPLDTVELENILQRFIDSNKPKAVYTITKNEKTINILITFEGISKSFLEIEGRLNTYNTGRCEEYSFEPAWFSDAEAEEYYNNNWEAIEEIVLNEVNL